MEKLLIFKQDEPILLTLVSSDNTFGILVDLIGEYTLTLRTDYFVSLTRAIIGQQLSIKAARTIWERVVRACGKITPENFLTVGDDSLRSAGVSRAKVSYIRDLSQNVLDGGVNLECLDLFDDDQVIDILTGIKGVGRWTAEMFLIFSLGRLDVLSLSDAGLRRGVKWLYRFNESPSSSDMERIGENWKPYRSVASLYLWEAINRGHVTG